MNPNESIKQKLERYQRTQELINQISFNRESKPQSQIEGSISQITTSRLLQAQTAIDKNDMEFVRSYIRTLSELDPANPYYTNLLKRDFIPWGEFQEIVNNFSANHSYMVRMQDEINNLRLAANQENEITEEPTPAVEESEQSAPSAQEEDQPQQQSGGQEESSSNQPSQRARNEPHRVIVQKPQKPQYGMTKEEYAKYKKEHKEERDTRAKELWEQRKKNRESSNEDEEEKKKKGLRKPGENKASAKNPLSNRLNNWLKNKFNNTRLGKSLQNLNQRFASTNLGRGLTRINNLLNAPSRFFSNLGSKLGNWAGNALKNLGSQALRSASQLASQIGRTLANTAARTLGNLASQVTGGAARTATMTAGRGALLVLANPITWAILAVVGLFILVWWSIADLENKANSECGKPGVVDIVKTGKNNQKEVQVKNGENIEYEIIVIYKVRCQKQTATIEVKDVLPENTSYISSSANVQRLDPSEPLAQTSQGERQGNAITWKINNILPERIATLSLVVKAEAGANNSWVINEVTVTHSYTSPGGSPVSAGFAPTQDNCGGSYQLNNPVGNFGDPKCDFDKDKLFAQLNQLDPSEAGYWFTVLIPKETIPPYNPNSYNPSSTSGKGAYGLFQMNPDEGKDTYDIGNVDWQRQTSNAINYNNVLARTGKAWCYWEAAKTRWTPKCSQP